MRGVCEMRVGGEQGFEGRGGDLGLGPKSHEKVRQGGTMTLFILEEGERGSGPREGRAVAVGGGQGQGPLTWNLQDSLMGCMLGGEGIARVPPEGWGVVGGVTAALIPGTWEMSRYMAKRNKVASLLTLRWQIVLGCLLEPVESRELSEAVRVVLGGLPLTCACSF